MTRVFISILLLSLLPGCLKKKDKNHSKKASHKVVKNHRKLRQYRRRGSGHIKPLHHSEQRQQYHDHKNSKGFPVRREDLLG